VWSTDSLLRSNNQEVTLSGSTTSYNVDGLTPGTRYYFKVFAKNRVTDAASTTGPYPDASIKNVVAEGTPVNIPNLTAANPSATVLGRVDLTWTAPPATLSPITRYKVYADNVEIGNVASTVLTFAATGLNERQVYSFTVRALNAYAVNNSTTGPNSDARSAKSPGVPTPPKGDLTGTTVGTSVNLFWNAPEDVGTTGGSITGYDVYKANFTPVTATGGAVTTVTRDGVSWRVHSFTNSAATENFVVSDAGSDGEIRYLVVGGGGSGGKADSSGASGGGGAGGFVTNTAFIGATTYTVTVGAGGALKTTVGRGNNGLASSITGTGISGASALGGGGGGNNTLSGANGGSGGGGGGGTASQAGGLGTTGQGRNGGSGFGSSTASSRRGGGGGGAGAPGTNATSSTAGAPGGAGLSSDIRTGSAVFYAGGGGGGKGTTKGGNPVGGTGGGGAGGETTSAGAAGVATTGGGGGGSGTGNGGAGGSGIVVITYPLAPPLIGKIVGPSPRTFTHTDREFAATYSYTVRARNAIADTNNTASADSNIFTITVSLTGPENFTVTPSVDTFGRLVLSWDAPPETTGYRIFDGNEVLLKELSDVTFYAIDNLTPGQTYSFKIRAISEAQPGGGYFSPAEGSISATPVSGTFQNVPNVSVTNDTNVGFSGTYAIISVTASTLEYARERPSYPTNTVPTGFGEITNITNETLIGDAVISSASLDTLSFTKGVGDFDISEDTSVAQGTLTNLTNVPLVGTKVSLEDTSGSSIRYAVDVDSEYTLEATTAIGTVTSLTSPQFNLSGAEIVSVTERSISYEVDIETSTEETSAAAGEVINRTNRDVFNKEGAVIDLVTGYNSFTYTIEGSGGLLDDDHSSTIDYPIDSVKKVSSEAEMKIKYRSGWLA
jgi:hypothetical protein